MSFLKGIQKQGAKEHGMMKHEGRKIPREVKSLADRIRAKDSGASDEYAYRTAWDIFEKRTSEGKKYEPKGGKHHEPSDIEGERKIKSQFHPHAKVGFIAGFIRE